MSWPSGSKAGTSNVDNGNDLLANARADIKQNIDNTNSIIDEFNISSPSDGDLLRYSSSTGKFEQVSSDDVAGVKIAIVEGDIGHTEDSSGDTTYNGTMSVRSGSNTSFVSVKDDSAGNTGSFTLQSGTYIVDHLIYHSFGLNTIDSLTVKLVPGPDAKDSAGDFLGIESTLTLESQVSGPTNVRYLPKWGCTFTLAAETDIDVEIEATGNVNTNYRPQFVITKIS
jgi:hypothetical protein